MHWTLIIAIIVAGTVSSFTDWLFMGVLFADRYKKYPETWWPRATKVDETKPILWSTAIGYITSAAVILLCIVADVHDYKGALIVAGLAAAAGPLVISPTNGLWVKIDPLVTLAHTAGYIVRFLIAGLAAGFVLS
jgi:hypothetical protein